MCCFSFCLFSRQVHLGEDLISTEQKMKHLKEQQFAAAEYKVESLIIYTLFPTHGLIWVSLGNGNFIQELCIFNHFDF